MAVDIICKVGRGSSSVAAGVLTAKASALETLQQGATPHPSTLKFATVHPKNANRDLRRALLSSRKARGFDLEPFGFALTQKLPRGVEHKKLPHYVIFPHELFHYVYKHGGSAWREGIIGEDPDGISNFWKHEAALPWCRNHPALLRPDELAYMVPFGLHGDEVADHKSGKILVLQWNAVLSRAPSMLSRWLYTVIDHRKMHGRQTLHELMVVFVWSMLAAFLGVFPDKDPWGTPWKPGTWRHRMAGSRIAGPFCLAFSEVRGDEEFMAWALY